MTDQERQGIVVDLRQDIIEDLYFKDRIDPADKRFRIVEYRIPADPSQPDYGPFEYHGEEAAIRLRLGAAAMCVGFGYIPNELGELIKDDIEQEIRSIKNRS